jgi:hypothetical protein
LQPIAAHVLLSLFHERFIVKHGAATGKRHYRDPAKD